MKYNSGLSRTARVGWDQRAALSLSVIPAG